MAFRDESIQLGFFRLGIEYTGREIAATGGVAVPGEIYNSGWDKGLVEFQNAAVVRHAQQEVAEK